MDDQMPSEHGLARNFSAAQQTFNTVTITVGSLYLATHSIVVTIMGKVAASALCGWRIWLALCREPAVTDPSRR
jgi:hypothetical protein